MKMKTTHLLAAITLTLAAACADDNKKGKAMETASEAPAQPDGKVVKTDE